MALTTDIGAKSDMGERQQPKCSPARARPHQMIEASRRAIEA
jgi:hypothetical protein